MYVELQFLLSAYHLIMFYIRTNFLENILNSFRVMKVICERQIEKATVTDGETNGQTCKYGKNNVSPEVGEK